MRNRLFVFIFSIIVINVNSQSIAKLKTDADCLKFIRENIKGFKDFYFDSLFKASELQQLKPGFKHWSILDWNKDKKPDLIFVGAFRVNYKPYVAAIYLSGPTSYTLVPLLRENKSSFRPHVFVREQEGKQLIVVQNYVDYKLQKVDDLVRANQLQRMYCEGDDTLMYTQGTMLNYFSKPARINFDSITLKFMYGWNCIVDSFVVYNDGRGKYFSGCYLPVIPTLAFQEEADNMQYLEFMVASIDPGQIRPYSSYGGTDNNAASFSIYTNGQRYSFYDYGLESSFTLKAIYKYFSDLMVDMW